MNDRGAQCGTRILRVIHGREARATFTAIRRREVGTGSVSDRVNDSTDIADLATTLGIERCLIENYFAFFSFGQLRDFAIASEQGQHPRIIKVGRLVS